MAQLRKLRWQLGAIPFFFCDTSLFDARADERIWEGLLTGKGNLVIVPQVRLELEPWLAANARHPAARALVEEDPSFHLLSYMDLPDWKFGALAYYVNLLGFRKRLFEFKELQFQDAHGRLPSDVEMVRLREELHREVGPRGYILAKKGAGKPLGPTFFTDEYLVCTALMTAIIEGREVVVLTKDEDVQEQFYKLQWLLDTHYRGMLLADLYATDPLRFAMHPLPELVPNIEDAFHIASSVLIERSRQQLDDVLPTAWEPVPISCLILGHWLTYNWFVAESGMARLLRVKGETGGLNTDRLSSRNCHIWLAPLDMPKHLRTCAVVASDRRLKLPSEWAKIPLLDL